MLYDDYGQARRDPTPRQREVLSALADGLTFEETARRLRMTERTARNTACQMYGRIGAHCAAHAVAMALRKGWIT